MIDLHIHTHYSDGKFSPEDILQAAAQRSLSTLAFTDHDNLNGFLHAAPLAAAAGIELIPAIEITTRWPGKQLPPEDANVDLLGYFVDPNDPGFLAFTQATLNDLQSRIADTCERLTHLGYPIGMDDIFAQNPRFGGSVQLVWALIEKGYASGWAESVRLLDQAWLLGRDALFTIRAAIEQVHLAGGVAILAHPAIVRPRGQMLTGGDLRDLVDTGLDGIEIYHFRLDEAARAHFLNLAREFDLLISGGSDLHGWRNGLEDLGSQPVSAEILENLRLRSAQRQAARAQTWPVQSIRRNL